jgi:hypothetical protein
LRKYRERDVKAEEFSKWIGMLPEHDKIQVLARLTDLGTHTQGLSGALYSSVMEKIRDQVRDEYLNLQVRFIPSPLPPKVNEISFEDQIKNRRVALHEATLLFESGDEAEDVLKVAEKYEAWLNRPQPEFLLFPFEDLEEK